MRDFTLSKGKAFLIYKEGNEKVRSILMDTFGAEPFTMTILEKITSYDDAVSYASKDIRKQCEIFLNDTLDVVAYKKLKLIATVLREEWIPNWDNSNEYKWFPVFSWSSGSGFDFSTSGYGCSNADTDVGSRLCFPTKELSDYFGRQFIDLHRIILTI